MRQVNVSEWSGILVYLECFQGRIHSAGLELLGEAWRLSGKLDQEIYAAAIGNGLDAVQTALKGYPVKKVFLYETEDEYTPFHYEKIMVSCIKEIQPAIVLIGGTCEGRALAPRLAVGFGTGLTADCTALEIDEAGNLVQTRPAFGGGIMASIVTEHCRPQFATVRPGVMEPVEPIFYVDTQFRKEVCKKSGERDVEIIAAEPVEASSDITNQKLLVVAGRGVKKKEDLAMLWELAELLHGRLACSRALVEKGWMQPENQIGLSGNTVSPEYMIACGVSGTVQFMAGMKNTKNIIAINTDPNARIFDIAHYPICGDLYEIVPELIEALKSRRGEEESEITI